MPNLVENYRELPDPNIQAHHGELEKTTDRAKREQGRLTVIPTAGSIENVSRLTAGQGHCAEMFAIVQDGTPVSAGAGLELLGRLPEPECQPMRLGSQPVEGTGREGQVLD